VGTVLGYTTGTWYDHVDGSHPQINWRNIKNARNTFDEHKRGYINKENPERETE